MLRSTVYPGTTEWLHAYLRQHGKQVGVAYCPERIVQGYAIEELQRLPQVISSTTPAALDVARRIFGSIAPQVVEMKPMEAEFSKLFANVYRYVQFAIANQFYMIASDAGLDYNRILEGMKRDYPRLAGLPSAGFAAGPCLFKDTMQLASFAQNQFHLGHAAMLINEGLVLYLVNKTAVATRAFVHERRTAGHGLQVDNDDTRSSLSYKLKKIPADPLPRGAHDRSPRDHRPRSRAPGGSPRPFRPAGPLRRIAPIAAWICVESECWTFGGSSDFESSAGRRFMATAAQRIGVGIVGIGFGRAVHLPALRLDFRFDVRAICASTLQRARRIADECGIPGAYGDWREMLAAAGMEAVTIAVPPPLQPAIALAALRTGKTCVLREAAGRYGGRRGTDGGNAAAGRLANMVDFEFLASPPGKPPKEALDARRVGPLRHIHAHWHVETYAMQHRLDSWKTDAAGGGTLLSFASHSFHYLDWLAGPARAAPGLAAPPPGRTGQCRFDGPGAIGVA